MIAAKMQLKDADYFQKNLPLWLTKLISNTHHFSIIMINCEKKKWFGCKMLKNGDLKAQLWVFVLGYDQYRL